MRERTWEDWRRLWLRAGERGLDLDWPEMTVTIGRLRDLAHAGLRARGVREEALLDPLFARLDARLVPADTMIDAFSRGGVPSLRRRVRARRLRSMTYQDDRPSLPVRLSSARAAPRRTVAAPAPGRPAPSRRHGGGS